MQKDKINQQCNSLMEIADDVMSCKVYSVKSPVSIEVPGTLSIADDFRVIQYQATASALIHQSQQLTTYTPNFI